MGMDGIRRGESVASSHHRRRKEGRIKERRRKGVRWGSRGYYCDKPMSKKVLFKVTFSILFLAMTLGKMLYRHTTTEDDRDKLETSVEKTRDNINNLI